MGWDIKDDKIVVQEVTNKGCKESKGCKGYEI